jgi:hypothetical protein
MPTLAGTCHNQMRGTRLLKHIVVSFLSGRLNHILFLNKALPKHLAFDAK